MPQGFTIVTISVLRTFRSKSEETIPQSDMCDFSEYGGASEEWLAFVKANPFPPYNFDTDLKLLQTTLNKAREEGSAKPWEQLRPHVRTADHSIPTRDGSTIEARTYRPISVPQDEILPVFIHFHGGGFFVGTLNSEDAVCANTAINAKCVVLNVNYRHTPEHTYPTAWHDSQDAFIWLHKNTEALKVDPSKVAVGGVSAGGQLTAALVLEKLQGKNEALNGLPDIAAQVLIIPALAHYQSFEEGALKMMKSREVSSVVENEDAPLLPMKTVYAFTKLLQVPKVELDDPKTNTLTAVTPEDIRKMPPTIFGIAGLDPLRDEALLYAKKLAEGGAPTEVRLFKGVPHGFRRFGAALKASAEWDKAVEDGIEFVRNKPVATGRFVVNVV